ncbi:hypothetical protein [Algoriphagus sediminis]|uniref:Uncharacterized protein n=1 Tax=Algoriphagus sediminis TaxID=3057113 RepID=A0ABT7Y938_9BACT|nr:hypothetical protein [Algoriphagus sediminis]MDN3202976.1 hypothetical protein [Algoriphagus sediminis]
MINSGISDQVNYSNLKSSLKTGDVMMFMGFNPTGDAIRRLEKLEGLEGFTHIGIVVEIADEKGNIQHYFWHAIPPDAINQFSPDYLKGVQADGCVLVTLDSVIDWVKKTNTDAGRTEFKLIVRKLNGENGKRGIGPDQLKDFITFMKQMAGRSFSHPVDMGMVLDYTAGLEASKLGGKSSSNTTFFCSKLSSATFQAAKLLPESLVVNSVLPGHFGSKSKQGKLQWQKGYSLGEDIYVQP